MAPTLGPADGSLVQFRPRYMHKLYFSYINIKLFILLGDKITAVIKLYTTKCSHCADKVPRDKLKIFTEYFFSTFMAHYKLYQYVFTKPREDKTKLEEVLIETTETPETFSKGKPENIWEYEQKLDEIDQAAKKRQSDLESELNNVQSQTEEQLKTTVETVEKMESPLTKEVSTFFFSNYLHNLLWFFFSFRNW